MVKHRPLIKLQSRLGNKPIITSANKHISGSFNAIHPDLKATVGVLSKTLPLCNGFIAYTTANKGCAVHVCIHCGCRPFNLQAEC